MSDQRIHPVILAGGSGTRLWPISRKGYPKQFTPLLGDESLFQASVRRLSGTEFAPPVVVTGDAFRFIVSEQIADCGLDPGAIVIEPDGRNTAPAALVAALLIRGADPDALMLVAPSDHAIPQADRFRSAVASAAPTARDGRLVTFGIAPVRPETGYGYLELDSGSDPVSGSPLPLRAFVEKPDADLAAELVRGGRHLWNAGIFLMSVEAVVEAFKAHAPRMLSAVEASLAEAACDLGFTRLDPERWADVEDISIDRAIMEKAENLSVMPYSGDWSDLGSWDAVWQGGARDAQGNALSSTATAIECRDSLLRSDGVRIVGIGLEGIVAVATRDAVLVARADACQRVKEAVEDLRRQEAPEADAFPTDRRPWGSFESLAKGDRFQVKRIVVKPGGVLSLQSHMHRAEHWIVVAGTAKVTVGSEVRLVAENQSIFVPLGEKHRMENPGKVPMVLIEVQTGSYLGEDDIIRYEDVYART